MSYPVDSYRTLLTRTRQRTHQLQLLTSTCTIARDSSTLSRQNMAILLQHRTPVTSSNLQRHPPQSGPDFFISADAYITKSTNGVLRPLQVQATRVCNTAYTRWMRKNRRDNGCNVSRNGCCYNRHEAWSSLNWPGFLAVACRWLVTILWSENCANTIYWMSQKSTLPETFGNIFT